MTSCHTWGLASSGKGQLPVLACAQQLSAHDILVLLTHWVSTKALLCTWLCGSLAFGGHRECSYLPSLVQEDLPAISWQWSSRLEEDAHSKARSQAPWEMGQFVRLGRDCSCSQSDLQLLRPWDHHSSLAWYKRRSPKGVPTFRYSGQS